jgi:hypothetical protein
MQRRDFGRDAIADTREDPQLFETPRLQVFRRLLEFLVFDQLPDQIPARILFIDIPSGGC